MAKQKVVIENGSKFGNWTVIEFSHYGKNSNPYYLCECTCQKRKAVLKHSLTSGDSTKCKSCSAKIHMTGKTNSKTHGFTDSPEYSSWAHMRRRCTDKTDKAYKNYGGRGITVCARWLDSFTNFLNDMGLKPSSKHSIDRIDNSGNYEPNNCRWATQLQQNRNKRVSKTKAEIKEATKVTLQNLPSGVSNDKQSNPPNRLI